MRAGALIRSAGLNVLTLRPILVGMAKKPEPPPPIAWTIYKIAARQTWMGTVEAPDEAARGGAALVGADVLTAVLKAMLPSCEDPALRLDRSEAPLRRSTRPSVGCARG